MKKLFAALAMLVVCVNLSACKNMSQPRSVTATNTETGERITTLNSEGATSGGAIGGNIANAMDVFDRTKLSRALDKAPDKETTWTNAMSGTTYTVTPVKKISVSGHQFCRNYNVIANKGEQSRQFSGNACVGADGNWQEV